MSGTTQGPRPVKVILGSALDELRERERRLQRVGDELSDVRRFIKVLAKAIGEEEHPKPTRVNPTGDTKRAILEAVSQSPDPMSVEEIADAIGREPAGWLSMQVKKQVGARRLVEVTPGRYGLACPVGQEDVA